MRSQNPRRVAVTGIGLVTPVGIGLEPTWEAIKAGKGGVGPITRFPTEGYKTTIAAEVKGFAAEDYMEKKAAKRLELFIQYAVAAAKMAVSDSGLSSVAGEKSGCVLGCGLGGLKSMEDNHAQIVAGRPDRISAFFIPMMIGNMAAGQVAIELGLLGPNLLAATACAAGTHAVGQAAQLIRDYDYDLMVTGGTESVVTPLAISGFNAIKAISTRNDAPEKASRPFDRDRDGFVVGEGAGILILEEWNRAQSRGARIYAEILGFGASCDAFHFTAPPDDGRGAVLAIRAALNDAAPRNLTLADIGYVNAHGTSTGLNDQVETKAMKQVFGPLAPKVPISSTKSMTGHLLGGAGGIESAFLALAIHEGVIPPTVNLDNPDPLCDLDYVPHQSRKADLRAAMSNSFGFGGTNGVIIMGKVGAWD
ncbi:MAG: beta-ketoacyl-ACP synthase II [Deltaproteobacteria bacterium]|nr:beta-ketoacyl-ACP synthase II [Deltaproteobacteria bacterium]